MRADAVRTRKALVAAAAEVFARSGADATVAEIAARAGIGKGTVFRHFPTKDDLLAAIVGDAVDELVAKAEHLVGHEDALREFMQLTAALLAGNRVLFDALDRVGADHRPQVRAQVDRLAAVAERVVAPARDAGVIRADVRGLDVVQLTCGAHHAAAPLAAVEPDVGQRYVDFVFAGLRAS
ncbi:TetR/AcrR family transcriptional regulator [Amycolatopsis sp. NPDC051372]|uniref:TetR/AcrR family transcriptional regulator n=1 Tax=Amycolatopsis sp. NPDC051372 TaxID=3155669 RepID=UPI0034215257